MGLCLSCFGGRKEKVHDPEVGQVIAEQQLELEPKTLYIAVMGATGSGKTTFVNAASGSELRVGMGLESCTNEVQTSQPFFVDSNRVVLIDTPGFDDTTKSDTEVLKMIAAYLRTMHEQKRTLSGVIYMHRISDFRVGGTTRRDFTMFQELCGQEAYKNVLLVTNMWKSEDDEVALAREQELREKDIFFKPILDNGAVLLRHMNDPGSALDIIRKLTAKDPVVLRIQSELEVANDITQTSAFAQLNRELMEQAERNRQELDTLRSELEEAAQAQDEETRMELQEEADKMEAELSRVQNESARLASEYQAELRRIEEQLSARAG
ncbi:P-loop containing nucleoside triphosphate hydrolase protein [Rhizopogon salebrosus TDB-379]|nr:P-loop containing nucleoside triphosphate hydrolase protein [Rhizopogon salebrosus TDB-379]